MTATSLHLRELLRTGDVDSIVTAIGQMARASNQITSPTLVGAMERIIGSAVNSALASMLTGIYPEGGCDQPVHEIQQAVQTAALQAALAVVELGPIELATMVERLLDRSSAESGDGVVLAKEGVYYKAALSQRGLPDLAYAPPGLDVTAAVRGLLEPGSAGAQISAGEIEPRKMRS